MSASQIFLVVVSALGVVHGLFLAVFLLIYKKGNRTSNQILSILLLVLSFRVGKSVFLEFTVDLDVKMVFIGLGTLMAIGPLYFLFSRSATNKTFELKSKYLLHFIPSLAGILFGFWLNDHRVEALPKLVFLFLFLGYYIHYLVYLLVTFSYVLKQRKIGLNDNTYHFLRLLFFGLLLIWIAYVLNLFDDLIPYVVGPILYSIVAYVISFVVFHRGYIAKLDYSKYKTTSVSEEQIHQLFKRVLEIVAEDKQYRDSNLTLKSLSESLKVSTQVLSMVINQQSELNFNNFINHYRIEESLELLRDPQYQNHTIASVAFEVGFNSISSFNTAFKKQIGKTPLDYRQQLTK